MRFAGGMKAEEVGVLREDHSLLASDVVELNLIRCADQPGSGRRGDIDAATPQTIRNDRIDVFVKMEADRPRHVGQPVFAAGEKAIGRSWSANASSAWIWALICSR